MILSSVAVGVDEVSGECRAVQADATLTTLVFTLGELSAAETSD
jgi:hypothetical protein